MLSIGTDPLDFDISPNPVSFICVHCAYDLFTSVYIFWFYVTCSSQLTPNNVEDVPVAVIASNRTQCLARCVGTHCIGCL